MQTQYHPHPFPHQDIYHMQPSYLGQTASSSSYASPTGLDLANFSRGSSLTYPHQGYRYPTDRGEPVSGSPLNLSNTSLCATGLGISGRVSTSGLQAEAIMDFPSQQWQWTAGAEFLHGLPLASVPHVPQVQLSVNLRQIKGAKQPTQSNHRFFHRPHNAPPLHLWLSCSTRPQHATIQRTRLKFLFARPLTLLAAARRSKPL